MSYVWEALHDRGIELQRLRDDNSLLWRIEVADYNWPPLRHSHIKLMVIDGETVIVSGYNMDDFYFRIDPDKRWPDAGMKLSGQIAQEALSVFDQLWERSSVCTQYIPGVGCINTAIMYATHPPEVTAPRNTGNGLNTFSLYRDSQDDTAERAIETAMAESATNINLYQDRVMYFDFIDALQGPVVPLLPAPGYVNGMIEALKNGTNVRYIVGGGNVVDLLDEYDNGREGLANAISYYNILRLYDHVMLRLELE